MGTTVEPRLLTESGENCLRRIAALLGFPLPVPQLVTSMVTTVEAHVGRVIARLIVLSDVQVDRFGAAMVAHLEDEFVRTWLARTQWLDKGFDVAVRGGTTYQQFNVVIELRNAVVHGDGQLTDLQTKNLNKMLILRKDLWNTLGVDCSGMRPQYPAASRDHVLDVVTKFVVAFDKEILTKFPAAARL